MRWADLVHSLAAQGTFNAPLTLQLRTLHRSFSLFFLLVMPVVEVLVVVVIPPIPPLPSSCCCCCCCGTTSGGATRGGGAVQQPVYCPWWYYFLLLLMSYPWGDKIYWSKNVGCSIGLELLICLVILFSFDDETQVLMINSNYSFVILVFTT